MVLGACQHRPLHDHRIPHHIADDDAKVSFESDHVAIDGKTGKPVADVTRYTYHDADMSIVVSFERQKTILQAILTDRAALLKRIIAQLIGFDSAYHRFTGKVTVEKFEGACAWSVSKIMPSGNRCISARRATSETDRKAVRG